MTRPSEVKPREGSAPGTPYATYVVGTELPELRFTVTPAIVEEYMAAVQADPSVYRIDDRKVAPPNVLCVFMTALIYRKYPPIQGIVMYEIDMESHNPIWADEETDVVATGRVTGKSEKRGRYFIHWEAEYRRGDGTLLARLRNTFNVPE